jgi:hypothetical protein
MALLVLRVIPPQRSSGAVRLCVLTATITHHRPQETFASVHTVLINTRTDGAVQEPSGKDECAMCALGEMVRLWRLWVLAGRGVLREGRAVDQSLKSTSALEKG